MEIQQGKGKDVNGKGDRRRADFLTAGLEP